MQSGSLHGSELNSLDNMGGDWSYQPTPIASLICSPVASIHDGMGRLSHDEARSARACASVFDVEPSRILSHSAGGVEGAP